MTFSAASKMARFLVGLAVIAALLVVSSHQLAARSVAELAGAGAVCALASDHGGEMPDDAACGVAGTGHSHCLPHSGCSAFTLPSAQPLDASPISRRWLRPQIHGLLGRTIPLETPPPITEA